MAPVEHAVGFDGERRVVPLRREFERGAVGLAVMALAVAVPVVLVFDLAITGLVVAEFALFFAVFGVVTYVAGSELRPGPGELPPPPDDARVAEPLTGLGRRTLALAAIGVAGGLLVAWIFDDPEMIACAFVGHLLGSAAADLAGALRVRHWEARHGRVVVVPTGAWADGDAPTPRLFAHMGPW